MKFLLIIPAALAIVATPALAQSADAGSQATNSVNVVAVTGDTGSSRMSGHVYGTPNVMGSSIIGSNNCLVGTGIGAAGGPIGLNISIGRSDKSCVRRNDAGAFHAMGMTDVAIGIMCQDEKIAQIFFDTRHYACPGTDRSKYKYADGSIAKPWPGVQR